MKASASSPSLRRHARLVALLTAFVFAAAFFASPMLAAPAGADDILVPGRATGSGSAGPAGSGSGPLTIVGAVALAGAGGWLLWRRRRNPLDARAARQLAIDETRSLGNRQFLVVASYRDKKYLLGVCPGRIDLLAPLHEPAEAPRE